MVLQSKMRQEDPSAHTEEFGWVVQPCCSITKLLGYNWFCFPPSACLLRVEAHIHGVMHFTLKWERKKSHTKDSKMKDLWFKQFSYFFYHRNLEFTGTACFCKYLIEWKNVAHHKKDKAQSLLGKKWWHFSRGALQAIPASLALKAVGNRNNSTEKFTCHILILDLRSVKLWSLAASQLKKKREHLKCEV